MKKWSKIAVICGWIAVSDVYATIKPTIKISEGWARPTRAGLNMSAGYLSLQNHGQTQLILERVTSSIGDVEIHQTIVKDGISRMKSVPNLTIEPGATISFEPGDLHLMLTNLMSPLKPGDIIPIEFHFKNAEPITAQFEIKD